MAETTFTRRFGPFSRWCGFWASLLAGVGAGIEGVVVVGGGWGMEGGGVVVVNDENDELADDAARRFVIHSHRNGI